MGTLTRPTGLATNSFDDALRIWKKHCRLYVSEGIAGDDNTPATKEALAALIDASTGVFAPLGRLTEDSGELDWEQFFDKVSEGKALGDVEVTATANVIAIDSDQLAWLDSANAKKKLSLLAIPLDRDDEFVIISGVDMTHKGKMLFNGGLSHCDLTFSGVYSTIGACIKVGTGLTSGT